jgi:DNA-binding SARP family transcriptional activator/Tfp pilus assembly protein PilF
MIALLGEVTAQVDRRVVDLGPARQRCVLAALAVDAGRLVSAEQVMRRVWGANTPRRGRATLHSHISRLRAALGDALVIVHRSDGYMLVTDRADQVVDLLRFRVLCEQARGVGEDTRKVALLTDALSLWRGDPLAGLSGEWVDGEGDRWLQERWAAEHDLVDAQLRIGRGQDLVANLSAHTAQHPWDERVAAQYMLALHRAGRTADALSHYRELRQRLVEELGTDPGTPLQNLHRQILAADPSLIPTPASTATKPVAIPRQLPAVPVPFVGRRDDLGRLDANLRARSPHSLSERGDRSDSTTADVPGGGMVVISAIGGAGGIGKSWLAVHWAHQRLDQFPDGQLFVDLRGFSPDSTPLAPAVAVRGFLDALGVDPGRVPVDPQAQTGLLRSLVAGKRMLMVLDNAADTEQVEPLLPGGDSCTVVVTSRRILTGLVTRHGARHLTLDPLSDSEARALLTQRLGSVRVAAEPTATSELVGLCGGLPLALGIIAGRAQTQPNGLLAEFAAELRSLGVGALDSDDPSASLPTVLSWSLRHLTKQQRQVFALLGIAPGRDTGRPAATALTGLPEREAHAVLHALVDASLIDQTPDGRYGMHDLVHAYATTIADNLPIQMRDAALRRVLDFYTHTAHVADHLLYPHRDSPRLDPSTSGVRPHPLPDAAAALAWFDTEHTCLLAAHHTATTRHWHAAVWHLAWSLDTFHFRRGHRHDRLTVWRAAADAAAHLPDPTTRTRAHRLLGYAYTDLEHLDNAIDHLYEALTLAEQDQEPTHQARTHRALAWIWERMGDDRQALQHARRALDLHRSLGQPVEEARALNAVGWYTARLGDYQAARAYCQKALDVHRRHHNHDGEANTLDSLGYIDHNSGRHRQSIDRYQHALTLRRDLGNTNEVANTLEKLGHPHTALGEHEHARTVWREALQLYRDQHRDDDAARIQHQLDNSQHNND